MPFTGNQYQPPSGSENAAPGQIVQSAVWNAVFTDLAAAITLLAEQVMPTPTTIAGIGTSQASAAAIGALNFYVRGNAQAAQYAFTVPASAAVGNNFKFFNIGAVTAVVWPPVGGTFNVAAGVTATGTSLQTNQGLAFLAVSASTFDVTLLA